VVGGEVGVAFDCGFDGVVGVAFDCGFGGVGD